MAEYVKTEWVDEEEPAIDAANLNKIEQGIKNLDELKRTSYQIVMSGWRF